MPSVAEMQMLNSSLEGLARVLMQRKELAAKDEEDKRKEELGRAMLGLRGQEVAESGASRREGLAAQQEHYKATREHEQRMEAQQKAILERQETQAAIRQMNAAYEQIQGKVNAGTMTPEEAKTQAESVRKLMETTPGLVWQNSHFGMVGTDFKKGEPDTYTEDPVTGERFLRPDGSHQRLHSGNRNPDVVREINPLTGEMQIKRVRTKGAGEPGLPDWLTTPRADTDDPVATRIKEIDKDIRKRQMLKATGRLSTGLLGLGAGQDAAITELEAEKAKLTPLMGAPTAAPGALPAGLPPPVAAPPAAVAPAPPPAGVGPINTPTNAPAQPDLGGGAPAAPKKLTLEQAAVFLELAGGDKEKARQLARSAGFGF